MTKLFLAASALALSATAANAAPSTYYGVDAGATSAQARPNSTAAKASFLAAAGSSTQTITFEQLATGYGTGVYSLGNGVTATLTNSVPAGLYSGVSTGNSASLGYNTTAGGTKYLGVEPSNDSIPASATFSFASPINAFGAFLTGVGTSIGALTANFDDGSQQSIAITGAPTGGVLFFGFTDPGKLISSVSLTETPPAGSFAGDTFGIDDVVYGTIGSAVPEPATWATVVLGVGAMGATLRRRRGRVATRVAFA